MLYGQEAHFKEAQKFTEERVDLLIGSNGIYPHWIEDQNRFWYRYETTEGEFWYMVNAEEETKKPLFNRKKMAAQLSNIFNRSFNYKDLELKGFEYDLHKGLFTFHVDSINFEYNVKTQTLIKQDSLEEKPDNYWKTYSPDSTWIAFAKNHNLYLMRANDSDSTAYQITTDGERWYSYQADAGDTTSNERLRASVRWFKDSEKLYVYRRDTRKVKELWVIHTLDDPRPTLETYKYAMPGEEHIGETEIWVFNADTLERSDGVLLQTATDKWQDETIAGVAMSMHSNYLWLMRRNRLYKNVDVLKCSTTNGDCELLWSEESKPYLNSRFTDLTVINGGEQYLWWSERTGWGQLYRYDNEGNLMNRITEGYYVAGDVVKVDTTAQTIYFEGYGREKGVNPYYSMMYKVQFDGSDMQRLTPENATHQIYASEAGNYFVDNYSRVNLPTKTVLRNEDGEVIMSLEETDVSRLKEMGWHPPNMFKVKAADGATDLHGVMWKPFNFDSTKTYPIIAYVYPEPQVEPFPISFDINNRALSLAQVGFIVIAMGQRGGSPLRPKWYHQYGYGNLRDYPLIDNKYGIQQLAARYDFINSNKVGIYGHSGGGFMSTAALLTYPDFYDVAVSSSGNHDNNVYNKWWSEMHNGVHKVTKTVDADTTKAGMQDSTVVNFKAPIETNIALAENLEGHLLLVTGTIDSNVHPANTIRMANALIKANKKFDYMIMPGQRHGYDDYADYFTRMVWHYFAKHLLGDKMSGVEYTIPEYK